MDPELKARLDRQDEALEALYTSVEKTRKYFLWLLIGSVLIFILPLLGLVFAIPSFLSLYTQIDGMGL